MQGRHTLVFMDKECTIQDLDRLRLTESVKGAG